MAAIPSLQDAVMLIIGFGGGTVFGWWARRFFYRRLKRALRKM